MRRLLIVPIVAVSTLLTACASGSDGDRSTPTLTATDSLLIACEGAAGALAALTPFKAKMKATEVQTINDSLELIDPVCADSDYSNPTDGLARIQPAVLELIKIRRSRDAG